MTFGIPSILFLVGVSTKFVKDGENGYLCTSTEEWKERLIELLSNTEQRKIIGQAGRKTVVEEYSVEANYGRYLEILEKS